MKMFACFAVPKRVRKAKSLSVSSRFSCRGSNKKESIFLVLI